ncbi:uncharacterized protein LOC21394715 [Morus notabilis]|uniref:uncharacterized protein LOC21394715 n=1 Tax=Morus notabilis TaxID=981085 RepID=UPI000CED4571|nr:uncharacterized protein LOC21394715 [Morus notabilis]XP_024022338.1 uncharacterized protein LOC21394715 [Morus notabilis]
MATNGDCVVSELDIEKKETEYEALEAKLRAVEAEKLAIEEQLEALKREIDELKERIHSGKDGFKTDFGGAKRIERVVDLTGDGLDEDRTTELMLVNTVLEIEKQRAERDAKAWENKFKELRLQMLDMQKNFVSGGEQWLLAGMSDGSKEKFVDLVDFVPILRSPDKWIGDLKPAGSASNYTPCKRDDWIKEEPKGVCLDSTVEYTTNQRVRRQLAFKQEKSSCKKMAPSTPAATRPSSRTIVDIVDSDEEPNNTRVKLPNDDAGDGKIVSPLECALEGNVTSEKGMTREMSLKQTNCDRNNVEDIGACKEKIPPVPTPKRKRAQNMVMSDTDSDSDDNIPISRLKRMNLGDIGPVHNDSYVNANTSVDTKKESATRPRRRLVPLRKCRGKGRSEEKPSSDTTESRCGRGISTHVDSEDDESDVTGSDDEDETLGGFIVDSSDESKGDEVSGETDGSSDEEEDLSKILSNFQRKREKNSKWELEGDMLADFGKDDELCMKAVCALYRQQTADEKASKGSLHHNNRGFNKFDAFRGTSLAEFLTGGDPQGDLKVSVKDLEKYDSKAVEWCRNWATKYSKQLFAIYENKEDPLFLP